MITSARSWTRPVAPGHSPGSTKIRYAWLGRLAALLAVVLSLPACVFPTVFLRTDPHTLVLLPGERVTVTVTSDPARCLPNQPCVDITGHVFEYVVQNLPAGVSASVDTSLQSPSTPGTVRIAFSASANASPGVHEVIVHATLSGHILDTAVLLLRILSPAGAATTAAPAAIAAGHSHSLTALADGRLLGWGSNDEGQLGLGDRTDRWTPTEVPIPVAVRAVFTGPEHTVALGADGSAWVWGNNDHHQLGLGEGVDSVTRPRQVPGLTAQAIAAGGSFSLALAADGSVWSWGAGPAGGDRASPGRVEELSGIRAIAAGASHALALGADGTVWAWGRNDLGQAGAAGPPFEPVEGPLQIPGLTDVTAIAAGEQFSLAVRADGTVWIWGQEIGNEAESDESAPVPRQVPDLSGIRAVAAGFDHALALGTDGSVRAWGRSALLGDGILDPDVRAIPVRVPGLSAVRAIAAGAGHSLAVLECGQLWSWGLNPVGQLGDNTTTQRLTPVPVAEVGLDSACARVALRVSVAGDGDGFAISSPQGLSCQDRECLGVFDRRSTVTLTAAPSFDSSFEGWAIDCQGPGLLTTVALDARKHCVAQLGRATPPPVLLTVVTDGGPVTSSGGGVLGPDSIDCEPTCSAIFPRNTTVTLTAADAGGFGFSRWGLDCSGTARQTSIVMDARHACRADFRPFTLDVAVTGDGRVTTEPPGIDCGATCSYEPRAGTAILRAEPALGWQFDGWGGDCTGAGLQLSVTMNADRACTAAFSRIPGHFLLTLIVEGTGSVTSAPPGIDCPGECVAVYPAGTAVDLTAVETPQSRVLGWFDDCAAPAVLANRVIMDRDRACRIRFTDRPAVPVAVVTFPPGPHPVGFAIRFDGSASHVLDPVTGTQDPAGIRIFTWDFESDGIVDVTGPRGTAAIVQHAFQSPGTYTVRLRVTGGPFDDTADRLHDVTVVSATGTLRALTVQKSGDGAGTIATNPPGLIGCGVGCTTAGPVQLDEGTVVTLVADADPFSSFDGWSQDCAGMTPTTQVVLDGDRACHAAFSPSPAAPALTVQVIKPAGSAGRIIGVSPPGNPINCDGTGPVCAATFAPGATVTVRPSDTSIELGLFGGWAGCDALGGLAACTVTLTGSRTVTATFVR